MSHTRAKLVVIPLAAAALLSCGTQTDVESQAEVADPSYFYEQVQRVQSLELNMIEPQNLAAALPAQPAIAGNAKAEAFSEVVVYGTVDSVEPGVGYIYTDSEAGDEAKETAFDDPAADARDVVVKVVITDAVGLGQQETVDFRMGVLLNADPAQFMASLRGLGEVAALLDRMPDGARTGEYYPIMSGAGIARVEVDGSLVFEGLGKEAASFTGAIETAPNLMNAAGTP